MPIDTSFPRISIVDIAGKGKGVIAKERILRGTLIISEKPRITLHGGNALEKIRALPREDLLFFMSFPCGPNEHPIFGRLKHFTPCVGDNAVGLCSTICRVNHTCYSPKGSPNAAYFWNVGTKEEELRALKEIHEEQEIEVSYMEDISNYTDPLTKLHEKFGFTCSCKGCARPATERRASEQCILAYNNFVECLPSRFGPGNPLQILKDIETQILIICEEGYTGEVGNRAHDAFQLCAYYGDAASARKWEEINRDHHALYQGPNSEYFKQAQRLAAKPQDIGQRWRQLGRRNLKGPSKQVLEYFYPKGETAQTVPNEGSSSNIVRTSAASTQVTSTGVADDPKAASTSALPAAQATSPSGADGTKAPSTSVPPRLSKGQKKKAKAKAKKEAAKETAEGSGEKVLAI
ncbi:hypothetical protein C8R44DRAFT_856684 [Mycena epipterygia]|nr:hypothetical protein C8R44DRAFT_856684 [Mycena epipterygia]